MLVNLKMKKKWKNMKFYEDPTKLPKKQKFKNLEIILNEDNYAVLPPQENRKYHLEYR